VVKKFAGTKTLFKLESPRLQDGSINKALMTITAGLKIYLDKSFKNRILLSAGVYRVDTLNGVTCITPTYIPKKPWRNPTKEEIDVLSASKNDLSSHQTVGIVKLPGKLAAKFRKLDFSNCKNHLETGALSATIEYKTLLNETISYYEKFADIKNSSIPHNIYLGDANLLNNTFNQKEKTFIGLHLDSFERNSETREGARNRICINLGRDPRYLLFYNLQFDQMAEMCNMEKVARNGNPYEILHTFFERFNTYPVIRIQINPYEAYIAPTENIIHDGSTEGTKNLDINLAIRGYFKIPKSRNLFANIFKI
jgi:hypothetical protein